MVQAIAAIEVVPKLSNYNNNLYNRLRSNMVKSILNTLVITLVVVVLLGLSCANMPKSEIPIIVSCDGIAEIGKPAPNFIWVGKDNIKHYLTDYRGKAIIVTTWNMTCDICKEHQLPYLSESYKKFADKGVYSLAINDMDSDQMLVEFLDEKTYPLTILRDNNHKFRSHYGLRPGDPWWVFIDKNGILLDTNIHGSDAASMKGAIDNFIDCQTRGVPYKRWEPLQITDLTVVKANSSFTVRWKTNNESTSIVIFTDSKRGLFIPSERKEELVLNHEIRINYSNLDPDIAYSVSVLSTDRYSETATTDAKESISFTTDTTSCGSIAPDFALISQEGKFVHLIDFTGKKVLLHFWSYTCHICAEELPLFKSFYSGLPKDKLELVTISVGGDITDINNYINERGYKFPVLFDTDGSVDTKYKNTGVPTTYLVSANGCILDKRDGAFDSLYDMREFTGTQY